MWNCQRFSNLLYFHYYIGRKSKHFEEYSQGGCATETEEYPRWIRKELAVGEKGLQSCLRFCSNAHGCLFFEFEEKTGWCHLHDKMITRSNGYPGVKCYRMVSSGPEDKAKTEDDVLGLEDDSGFADKEYFTRNDEYDEDLDDDEEIESDGQYNSDQEGIDEDFEMENEENGSGGNQNFDVPLEYNDYDNDMFIEQEHDQEDYDDEDQVGDYMDQDEYDDKVITSTGHSFVNQIHDTESSDDPPHDPEFLDRDYEIGTEHQNENHEGNKKKESTRPGHQNKTIIHIHGTTENPRHLELFDKVYDESNKDQVGDYMDQDDYDDEHTTRTGHPFGNHSPNTEATDDSPRDPEFFDRDYENDPEFDEYTEEEEPMITEKPHTYSDIHIKTNQKLSSLSFSEFIGKDYDNVLKSHTVRDTKDSALAISTGFFAVLAVIAILITAFRCKSNKKSKSSVLPTTWDTQKAKELVPVIRGFHPKTAGGYENLCGMENSNCVLDEEDLMLKSPV